MANIPNPVDGTSYYRAGGVFPHLMKIMPELEITPNPSTYDWFMFGFADLFFMQRPYTDQHMHMVEMAKSNCVPIWIDYDDDLFSVPRNNPTYGVYGQTSIQRNVVKMLQTADVVSVSTDFLKRKIEKLNPNIVVIKNALNDHLLNARPEIGQKKMVINWRGSPTHQKDVGIYAQQIVKAAKKFPDWKWHFVGHSFWGLIEAMPKESVVECAALDPVMYWHFIGQLQPGLQIVPLEDNIFNHSKSNIAWQEAAYSGCGSLVPDWEEWRNPGSLLYRTQEDFYNHLESVLMGRTNLQKLGEEAWTGVTEKFLLSDINPQRAQLIRDVVAKGRKPFVHAPLVVCSPRPQALSSESSQNTASLPEPKPISTESKESPPPSITNINEIGTEESDSQKKPLPLGTALYSNSKHKPEVGSLRES